MFTQTNVAIASLHCGNKMKINKFIDIQQNYFLSGSELPIAGLSKVYLMKKNVFFAQIKKKKFSLKADQFFGRFKVVFFLFYCLILLKFQGLKI